MKDNKQRLFEVMGKVNPDFVVKEAAPTPPAPTVAPPRPNRRNPSFIDDDTLSVGELKAAIIIYSHAESKEAALAAAKESGADILKCVVGLIGAAGFVAGTVASGGIVAAVAGGFLVSAAGAASTVHDTRNVFKKLLGPKPKAAPKVPSGMMQLLDISPEVSILLDDAIEERFVEFAVNKLNSMPDTAPIPNFFNELREFIKQYYAQTYNIAYGQTPAASQ